MILTLCSMASALTLTYTDALSRASEANPDVKVAGTQVEAAEGALLSARSPFEPQVSASGTYFSNTNDGAFQFGRFFADTSGWSTAVGVNRTLATGTSVGVEFSSSQNRFLYRLAEQDVEFTDDPQYQSNLAFSVSQALLQGHRLAYNLQGVNAAESSRSIAEANQRSRRNQVLAQTAQAYWSARSASALIGVAEQTLEMAKETRR